MGSQLGSMLLHGGYDVQVRPVRREDAQGAPAPILSADFGGERPRFKQLTDWLGPDFDGAIAFDDAHLMKNAAGTLPRSPSQAPLPDSGV